MTSWSSPNSLWQVSLGQDGFATIPSSQTCLSTTFNFANFDVTGCNRQVQVWQVSVWQLWLANSLSSRICLSTTSTVATIDVESWRSTSQFWHASVWQVGLAKIPLHKSESTTSTLTISMWHVEHRQHSFDKFHFDKLELLRVHLYKPVRRLHRLWQLRSVQVEARLLSLDKFQFDKLGLLPVQLDKPVYRLQRM